MEPFAFPRFVFRICAVLISMALGASTSVASADPTATYSSVKQSLALVVSRSGKKVGMGTAFCIGNHNGSAYFLTNKHVVGNDPNPQMVLSSDPSSLLHGAVRRTAIIDAAVLSVPDESCKPLTLSRSQPPVGTQIAIAGYPAVQIALSDGDLSKLSPSFHEGTVSAIADDGNVVEYDAQTDHGNSGSPLFDVQSGVVYGLVTWVTTGTTAALQNNFAISVLSLASFLDNSRANVAYASQPSESVASPPSLSAAPGTIAASIDVHCGSGTMAALFKGLNKAFGEMNANDYPTATTDARAVVESASSCVIVTPNPCRAGAAPCNDFQHVAVEGAELAGQQIIRISTARMNGDSLDALRNEVMSVLDLCNSPNILSAGETYQSLRAFMTGTIQTVSKVSHLKAGANSVDVAGVRACATRLGVEF